VVVRASIKSSSSKNAHQLTKARANRGQRLRTVWGGLQGHEAPSPPSLPPTTTGRLALNLAATPSGPS
jgi:hypothetical protein